jgi:single-strand DNA-binding protein
MEIIGRVTKDATVTKLKDERQVVNFSIVMNDYFKPKGDAEGVKITTYVNCDYWINPKIATRLTKGKIVELSGRIGVNTYNNQQGQAKATLTFHVNSIKLYGNAKSKDDVNTNDMVAIEETADDLPF